MSGDYRILKAVRCLIAGVLPYTRKNHLALIQIPPLRSSIIAFSFITVIVRPQIIFVRNSTFHMGISPSTHKVTNFLFWWWSWFLLSARWPYMIRSTRYESFANNRMTYFYWRSVHEMRLNVSFWAGSRSSVSLRLYVPIFPSDIIVSAPLEKWYIVPPK